MRRSKAQESCRDVDEPRWVADGDARDEEPVSLYARTYAGIGRSQEEPVDPRRRGRLALVALLATGAVVALAITMPSIVRRLPLAAAPPTAAPPTTKTAVAHGPDVIGTSPARPKMTLHVGEVADFAIAANGTDLRYGWTVDGKPAAGGPRFLYSPAPGDVGHRRVEVTVTSREGTTARAWTTRVLAPRPPRMLAAEPAPATVDVVAGSPLRLRVSAGTPAGEPTKTTWTFGDATVGTGDEITLHPARPGAYTVRALVSNALRGTADRTWQVNVLAPPSPPAPTPAAAPKDEAPAPAREPAQEARVETPRDARAQRRPPPAPERRTMSDDVRRWLERYAAAWRAHDVEALRRMGQVTTPIEVDALRRYFSNAQDLDVEVNLLALRTEGDRAVVRFTRRDRFRDPAGRLLLRESPPIEKELMRTSDGFRIVRTPG